MQPSNTPEEWRPVVGHEDRYEVSSAGRIRSIPREFTDKLGRPYRVKQALLSLATRYTGHKMARLQGEDRATTFYVHRLVLEAFVGPCPEGMEACHNNGVPDDNRVENLRWDTRSANRLDRVAHGVDQNAKKTHCKQGHEFTPENTYRSPNGNKRACVTCKRKWDRERKRRVRAAHVLAEGGDRDE